MNGIRGCFLTTFLGFMKDKFGKDKITEDELIEVLE